MKPGLVPGRFVELRVAVTPEMCPHFDGVLVHPVYATWTLVHDFEVAGRKLLAPHLEPHEEGVGAHIHVDHRSPAYIGSVVTIRAEVERCEPHRLTTHMTACCGERLVADGKFIQIILARTHLEAAFERARPPQPRGPIG